VFVYDADQSWEAVMRAGIDHTHTDHGIVQRSTNGGIGVIVYEFGLYVDPTKQSFFAIDGNLYAGNAVLYAFGAHGETIDMGMPPNIKFFDSIAEIESHIRLGKLNRPTMSLNGQVMWQWPQARK
jgi:hypothetical protein